MSDRPRERTSHDKTYEAVCERGEGQYDRIVVPIELHGGIPPHEVKVECPQCGREIEVRRANG